MILHPLLWKQRPILAIDFDLKVMAKRYKWNESGQQGNACSFLIHSLSLVSLHSFSNASHFIPYTFVHHMIMLFEILSSIYQKCTGLVDDLCIECVYVCSASQTYRSIVLYGILCKYLSFNMLIVIDDVIMHVRCHCPIPKSVFTDDGGRAFQVNTIPWWWQRERESACWHKIL